MYSIGDNSVGVYAFLDQKNMPVALSGSRDGKTNFIDSCLYNPTFITPIPEFFYLHIVGSIMFIGVPGPRDGNLLEAEQLRAVHQHGRIRAAAPASIRARWMGTDNRSNHVQLAVLARDRCCRILRVNVQRKSGIHHHNLPPVRVACAVRNAVPPAARLYNLAYYCDLPVNGHHRKHQQQHRVPHFSSLSHNLPRS
ncbi:hypothetical protein AYI69_g3409 [Smittium culicis]|uniref:Uncharacterized protein n=1 Tax=Smittium culicis TaxID=133412 RepID=A0A1R1YJV2_9FUNG|nr:hypothetical protein AYI69_g3409 [Smittium culicis]